MWLRDGYEVKRDYQFDRLTGAFGQDCRHIGPEGKVKADFIHLVVFDTKTGAERIIPVSSRLKAVLKRRLNALGSDDLVFTNTFRGKPRKYRGPDHMCEKMKAVCTKAGVTYGDKAVNNKGERIGVTFHCLRHTRTTRWVEMGFSDEIIRRATGHKTLEAYRNYVKINSPAVMMRLVSDENSNMSKSGTKTVQTIAASESKV